MPSAVEPFVRSRQYPIQIHEYTGQKRTTKSDLGSREKYGRPRCNTTFVQQGRSSTPKFSYQYRQRELYAFKGGFSCQNGSDISKTRTRASIDTVVLSCDLYSGATTVDYPILSRGTIAIVTDGQVYQRTRRWSKKHKRLTFVRVCH